MTLFGKDIVKLDKVFVALIINVATTEQRRPSTKRDALVTENVVIAKVDQGRSIVHQQ